MSNINHVDTLASKRRKRNALLVEPSHVEPKPANHLLACYLAHEFLSHGTLFGRRYHQLEAEPPKQAESGSLSLRAFADVSGLLKDDVVHLPEIVNPSQLARWIGM